MRIYISGKSENVNNKELRYASKYFLNLLNVSERLKKKLKIFISFDPEEECASVMSIDDHHRPREFSLCLNPKMSKRKTLQSLAHEIVHVKQYARGELKHLLRRSEAKWLDTYIPEDTFYFERPWEIEAFGRELGLYLQYNHHKKTDKLKF
jgi:hypothetical protein